MFLLRGHDSIKKNLIIAKLKYEDNMTLLHRGRYSFYATEYSPESSTYEPGWGPINTKIQTLIHFEIPSTLFSLISLHPYLMLPIDIQFDTSLTKKFLIT